MLSLLWSGSTTYSADEGMPLRITASVGVTGDMGGGMVGSDIAIPVSTARTPVYQKKPILLPLTHNVNYICSENLFIHWSLTCRLKWWESDPCRHNIWDWSILSQGWGKPWKGCQHFLIIVRTQVNHCINNSLSEKIIPFAAHPQCYSYFHWKLIHVVITNLQARMVGERPMLAQHLALVRPVSSVRQSMEELPTFSYYCQDKGKPFNKHRFNKNISFLYRTPRMLFILCTENLFNYWSLTCRLKCWEIDPWWRINCH